MANEVSSSSSSSAPSTSHFFFTVIQPARPCLARREMVQNEREGVPLPCYSSREVNLEWQFTPGVHLDVSGLSLSMSTAPAFLISGRQYFNVLSIERILVSVPWPMRSKVSWFSQHTREESLCCKKKKPLYLSPSSMHVLTSEAQSWWNHSTGQRLSPARWVQSLPCVSSAAMHWRPTSTPLFLGLYQLTGSAAAHRGVALLCPISCCLHILLWSQF